MSNIVAVITVFYPQIAHIENIKKISEQVNKVIICDNSSVENSRLFSGMSNLYYCYWGENLGLSLGFNRILKDKNFSWSDDSYVVFFDQDTKIPNQHIIKLINDYSWLMSHGFSVGCIGPVFFNESIEKIEIPTLKKRISNNIIQVKSTITSSMLCRYIDLKRIGFWNEEIFLDMADWDVCWRFAKNGFQCFMTSSSIINHKVGEGKKNIFGIFDIRIAKPFREYYQTRDCLYLFWKDYIPWNFRIRFIIRLIIRPILHIMFLDKPKLRLNFILKGFKDYLNNIHGALKIKE